MTTGKHRSAYHAKVSGCIKIINRVLTVLAALTIAFALPASASATECGAAKCAPSFDDYPVVEHSQPFPSISLILQTRLAKQYRTVITQPSREGADLAGHYRVATWGCGTDCHGFAIINKRNGKVYTMPGVDYVAGVMGNAEDRLAYRLNSSLFVITGRKNDEDEGKFYYLWNGRLLKLILKTEIAKESFDE
ncbi:hypothetical protein [Niveibacterium microcysteis]|uniref:Lipoprotein n=1 Tax=Niveibacterium microcysteis TaxID=2811415 RepID=A0ABX7M5Q0_9RHOO|nr:hypothetical protein [Niveibacterium microcysteis]QSI77077.1 hypothetical protein JY500_00040 [Niveibacterium microcysteis]